LEQKKPLSRRETILVAGSGMVLEAEPLARIPCRMAGRPALWRLLNAAAYALNCKLAETSASSAGSIAAIDGVAH
jgi:hypothetical protein